MDYGISEGYGILLVTELVDTENPWVITGYGLSQVWFRTESTVISCSAILSVKVLVCDPSLPLFDHLVRPGQILSTDGRVLIIDQICLVIPDPRQ